MDIPSFDMRPHVKVAQLGDSEALQRGEQAPDRNAHPEDPDPTDLVFVM
jgi:hypothetical protein